jgi:hypothetical protein
MDPHKIHVVEILRPGGPRNMQPGGYVLVEESMLALQRSVAGQ